MFSPLYIKTNNTILSSIIKIDELITYAKNNNIKALSITDENMYGVMDFYKACINNNIKPIIGLNLKSPLNLIIYAKDKIGYKNIIKLATLKTERELTVNDLAKHNDGLICVIPFISNKYYENLKKIYNDIYQGYSTTSEREVLTGKNLVFVNEILYLEKNDKEFLKYALGIRDGINISEIKVNNDNHMMFQENLTIYPNEDLENNFKIVESCNLEINYTDSLLPKYDTSDSFAELKKQCIEGLIRIFGKEVSAIYKERLKYELNIINQMNFCDYFLVVADFIKYAKENDIYIGPGRGSAAGSLVSYILNITTVDPIKYNLLFERFLNPERVTMPDIDIDIEDTARDKVLKYCQDKYGFKKVVPIIAFGTMKSKQAIRDVGRTLGVELSKVDYVSKQLNANLSLTENLKNIKLKEHINMDPVLKKLYDAAIKLEGIKRNTTVHAAGVIMSNVNIDEVVPLDKSHDEFYTTQYDMTYLEELGLLKMDFLSLKTLSTYHSIIKEVGKVNIPLNDKKTLEIFKKGDTLGIFQFESEGMKTFLRKLKPTSFDDIVAANALYRPGPEQFIENYINRKYGKEKIDYIDKSLESILKPTYGIIIYQEQIMQTARIMAGYSLGEADILRRAMSKKKEKTILEQKEVFIKKSVNLGYSLENATKVFEMILKFAQYGFNKSHSLAYSVLAYKLAYLKANYRPYFMKSILNNTIGAIDKLKEYINECKKNNIKIIKPDINLSSNEFIADDNSLIFPLNGIKGIGNVAVNNIIDERKNGEYKHIFDFLKRCYNKSVNKKIIETLILSGVFDKFEYSRQTLLYNLDNLINYAEISDGLDMDLYPELIIKEEFNDNELLTQELELYGFYLTKHPVELYRNQNHNRLEENRKNVKTVLLVNSVRVINTKTGKKMAFMTASDETKEIDLVMFNSLFENNNNILVNNIIEVSGKYEIRDNKEQIVINEIKIIK